MPLKRFYGATDALFDTDFTLPDFEEVTLALPASMMMTPDHFGRVRRIIREEPATSRRE